MNVNNLKVKRIEIPLINSKKAIAFTKQWLIINNAVP